MWVVKIGGSLQFFAGLRDWLDVIAAQGGGQVVVVPGGGRFADAVRAAQKEWGFDDQTADRMALLAMEQYGRMLISLAPGLHPAETEENIHALLATGQVPVWLPRRTILSDRGVPASWDFSSDSLSLWLARRLEAEALILVKSMPVPRPAPSLDNLVGQEAVDRGFPQLARNYAGAIGWFECGESERLAAALVTRDLSACALLKKETPRAAAQGAA